MVEPLANSSPFREDYDFCAQISTSFFSSCTVSDCSEFSPPQKWSPIKKAAASPCSKHDTSNDRSTCNPFFLAKNNAGNEETQGQSLWKSVHWTPHLIGSVSVTKLLHQNEECTPLTPEVSTFSQRHGPRPPTMDVSNLLQKCSSPLFEGIVFPPDRTSRVHIKSSCASAYTKKTLTTSSNRRLGQPRKWESCVSETKVLTWCALKENDSRITEYIWSKID